MLKMQKGNSNSIENKEQQNVTTIRHLQPHEEDKWLDMVASCYSTKGTPRNVFKCHLERTPAKERRLLAIMDKGW